MLTHLWQADSVPYNVPNFVDTHITVDYDPLGNMKKYYLFEVDPAHKTFNDIPDLIRHAEYLLTEFGFKNPRFILAADRPSCLTTCQCFKCAKAKSSNFKTKPRKPKGFNFN